MKVLATRRYPGPAFADLDDVEIVRLEELDEPRPGARALITANERVDGDLLDRLPDLELVANFGVGVDRIDVAVCARRGIAVTNTPGVLDSAVADLTLALMLAVRRRVVEGDGVVRRGGWRYGWADGFTSSEVTGARLGIVGFGRIGQAVARRARGFEMEIVYTRRNRLDSATERDLGVEYRDLDHLLAACDVVTLHVPLTPETDGLVDARRLALMPEGACLVNTSRGEIVDERALVDQLASGRLQAGLDVFVHEPDVPRELMALPNVVLTPHMASATTATREAMTRLAVDNVLALERRDPLLTPVEP